jgi:3-(3-hydroxy-phenyl)propionate hydroxylase
VLDATLVRATDKATVTLSHLTRGEAWTLLLFGGLHPAPEDAQARAALASETAERFGARVSIFGVDAAAKAPAEFPGVCLLDMLRHAHERYGVADAAFYLLRPDTYVSARGSMRHAPKLIAHLESLFT